MQGRRGRPPKAPPEVATDEARAIAEILASWCGINGCSPKIHEEEARDIIYNLKRAGYYVVKGQALSPINDERNDDE